jgi:hypothetical protein
LSYTELRKGGERKGVEKGYGMKWRGEVERNSK